MAVNRLNSLANRKGFVKGLQKEHRTANEVSTRRRSWDPILKWKKMALCA